MAVTSSRKRRAGRFRDLDREETSQNLRTGGGTPGCVASGKRKAEETREFSCDGTVQAQDSIPRDISPDYMEPCLHAHRIDTEEGEALQPRKRRCLDFPTPEKMCLFIVSWQSQCVDAEKHILPQCATWVRYR